MKKLTMVAVLFIGIYVANSNVVTNQFSDGSQKAIRFTENKGQVKGFDELPHPEIKFYVESGNLRLFLTNKGIAYQFTNVHYPEGYTQLMRENGVKSIEKINVLEKRIFTETFRMSMQLAGANIHSEITTSGKSLDYMNYSSLGIMNVHSYETITYHDIYPGIDWAFYSKDGQLKYDFVIKPGADPSVIKFVFTDHEGLILNEDGSYSLKNRLGAITEKAPASYQDKKEISSHFVLTGNELGFKIDAYDKTKTLTIDPTLAWATYYGDVNYNGGSGVVTDALGNVYLCGRTSPSTMLAASGYQMVYGGGNYDGFLVKFNSTGSRLWATYFGGSSLDQAMYCVTDASNNIFISGNTGSAAGIASGGHQNIFGGGVDAFLAKFDSNGLLQWSTYYGDSGGEAGHSCAVDASGNVYLTGETTSTLNIAASGYQNVCGGMADLFLVKFNSSGVRQWATYYGGSDNENSGHTCSIDKQGNIYLNGQTSSLAGIASGGFQNTFGGGTTDAFLVKFNSTGALQWATYYGGTGDDGGVATALDTSGNVFFAGYAQSSSNIASMGHQNNFGGICDAFLVKFTSAGTRLWATYYGDTGNDDGRFCATDALGNIYLLGATGSAAGIAVNGYQTSFSGGVFDAFLTKFDNNGVRQWGTYYGGSGSEYPYVCSFDFLQNLYFTGETDSGAGIASGGFQNTNGGGNADAFLVKFCGTYQSFAVNGPTLVCNGSAGSYSASGSNASPFYQWNFPAGWNGTSNTNVVNVTPSSTGVLSVSIQNGLCASAISTLAITLQQCTGIEETKNSSIKYMVWPNPGNGPYTLELHESAVLLIYNGLGKTILKTIATTGQNTIDLSQHSPGIYFMELRQNGASVFGKIIKE